MGSRDLEKWRRFRDQTVVFERNHEAETKKEVMRTWRDGARSALSMTGIRSPDQPSLPDGSLRNVRTKTSIRLHPSTM